MDDARFDVVVIGSGPGGYVCALRAAQLGLRVACVEKDVTLGGTCLNVGCIPSKALLESSERYASILHDTESHGIAVGQVSFDLAAMLKRKEDMVSELVGGIGMLFKKNKIHRFNGFGSIVKPNAVRIQSDDGEQEIMADAIVIATGSEPSPLAGIPFDGQRVVSSTEALSFESVPEHLVVVGAGVIGLELGSVWKRLGAKVTVLEYLDRILPGVDLEIARQALKAFKQQGMEFVLGARAQSTEIEGDGVRLTWTAANESDGQQPQTVSADRILVAIGRRPYTANLGCDEVGIELDDRGRIKVDRDFQTSVDGIFAIGDVVAGPMLAHKASDEGIALAETLAGDHGHINYEAIPSIVYTHPEIAGLGKTEEACKEEAIPYKKGRFRYASNGRAMGMGERDGMVKILAHKETDRIIGCHIVGARAGDLIAEIAIAVEFGASVEDIARSVHAHPTLSEIVREAALDADKRAIHK
jgi:dihydrolipoamide dehydrogenase